MNVDLATENIVYTKNCFPTTLGNYNNNQLKQNSFTYGVLGASVLNFSKATTTSLQVDTALLAKPILNLTLTARVCTPLYTTSTLDTTVTFPNLNVEIGSSTIIYNTALTPYSLTNPTSCTDTQFFYQVKVNGLTTLPSFITFDPYSLTLSWPNVGNINAGTYSV